MRMNRRNVLVGLGTIVAGGGAALGTGAFSTVEADRTVNVSTATDSEALLAIEVAAGHGTATDGEASINLDNPGNSSGLNVEARTRYNAILALTNQGSDPVSISLDSASIADGTINGESIDSTTTESVSSNTVGIDLIADESYSDGDLEGRFNDSSTADDGSGSTGTVATNVSEVSQGETAVFDIVIELRGSGISDGSTFDIDLTISAT
ncbi:hypothetical protein [Natrinema sp. CGMCC1.2065]|uniref:hypothetical protein n=1 Tax=Natrinema sp. CGMCC1.2065 TaxID=3445767 RepID=UPI003F49E703